MSASSDGSGARGEGFPERRRRTMSRSLNKATLIGNVGADPEIRTTGAGTRVANFRVATTRRYTDRNGQEQENTQWHSVVAWEKLAEVVERFVQKGERVFVEGEIEYRQYEAKEGGTRYVTEIRARELILLSGRAEGSAPAGGGERRARAAEPVAAGRGGGRAAPKYDDFVAPGDDDLPF
jgi:single-strand DNA-binding protein